MRNLSKVLLITNIPTPYRIPLFNELNKQLNDLGIKFKVVFGAASYGRRQWEVNELNFKFTYVILNSKNIYNNSTEKSSFTYNGLYRIIKNYEPDVIITSGFSLASTKIFFLSFIYPIPFIIWSGDIDRIKYLKYSYFRIFQRRVLIKKASNFVAYGTKAKEYLIKLGANPKKIYIGINTVDTKFFKDRTESLRNRFEWTPSKNILYIGNLTRGKRLDLLISAVGILSHMRRDFMLYIIGQGSEYEALKFQVKNLNLDCYVKFEGFRQKDELPNYLATTSCFVFPSEYDVWGLVLVEAMAAGIPCIASDKSGATLDLIQNEKNGFVVDFHNIEVVVSKINWIFNNKEKAREMGNKASNYINEKANIELSAKGFVHAINNAINER